MLRESGCLSFLWKAQEPETQITDFLWSVSVPSEKSNQVLWGVMWWGWPWNQGDGVRDSNKGHWWLMGSLIHNWTKNRDCFESQKERRWNQIKDNNSIEITSLHLRVWQKKGTNSRIFLVHIEKKKHIIIIIPPFLVRVWLSRVFSKCMTKRWQKQVKHKGGHASEEWRYQQR